MVIHRKLIWLMILMIWVGMVTSIIVYQGREFDSIQSTYTQSVEMQDEKNISDSAEVLTELQYKELEYLVDSQNEAKKGNEKDFFLEYRLERDKARSEQVSLLREMINNPNTDQASKLKAQDKMLSLTDKIEKEMEIESLVRARGYTDALAFLHDNTADIIIQANGLEKADAAKIGDIIHKTTGLAFDDITIIEKKNDN